MFLLSGDVNTTVGRVRLYAEGTLMMSQNYNTCAVVEPVIELAKKPTQLLVSQCLVNSDCYEYIYENDKLRYQPSSLTVGI